ncbi:hypothetical protein EYB45_08155 [Erythrobacteraceae bacterium CFH 75059]|uniref:hypothetical protein n=1 Tax=Qipengyuania thermophila TaxID=2509361 RepID=UPI0010204C84|nr:hypothetical protein [Qipengyuania thermophila]TCD05433.1 hypothetical protein EYB45_08155 [Erythrobacteraceae bacterium CFH 75059]
MTLHTAILSPGAAADTHDPVGSTSTVSAPSLTALIDELPADDTRAAQHQFTAARQAAFLSRLAECGSARSAARAAGVSHQTAYRQRRACAQFRRAWDAALLVARTQAEEVLACRALDGVEEEVWFRGEVVGTRRRYDARLLLAHLARLDRLVEDADTAALAEDFDTVLATVESGGALPPPPDPAPACAGSGRCHTRSMSAPAPGGSGVMAPTLEERWAAMEAARPPRAPLPEELSEDPDLALAQFAAFEEGLEEWWLIASWEELDERLDARAAGAKTDADEGAGDEGGGDGAD